jgi:alginate O-acetyltransferase complex protein AlgI
LVFSSLFFIFAFLPLSLAVFYSIKVLFGNNRRALNISLVFLSLAFYFWGSGAMLSLLVASTVLNWFIGQMITSSASKNIKYLLMVGIGLNLSILAYFKYWRFFLDTVGALINVPLATDLHPSLPVGVSFYTFMAISYLVEVYRLPKEKATLLEFGTYLSLFPHLVAGPIVRFGELAADLRQRNMLTVDNFSHGIFRFAQGLGMKVLIADNLSPTADHIFGMSQSQLNFTTSWLGAICYTFQIYFDFAGYSAMAIGLALMFGFHFPENFNQPYVATSITEFWKRWHISLSRWLRDYLYIPLGGNQKGNARTYLNLFIVFFVCGLWHGAAWTFVVWGLYHGALLIVERFMKSNWNFESSGLLGFIATFLLTVVGWVIFRSNSFSACVGYLKAMFLLSDGPVFSETAGTLAEFMDPLVVACLLAAALISFLPWQRVLAPLRSDSAGAVLGKVLLTAMLLFFVAIYAVGNTYKPFIYFRF